jgi:hypothetical protein
MWFELFVFLALAVGVWRWARRWTWSSEPLPNVPDAPASAEPIATARLSDDGLFTYSLDLHATEERMASDRSND